MKYLVLPAWRQCTCKFSWNSIKSLGFRTPIMHCIVAQRAYVVLSSITYVRAIVSPYPTQSGALHTVPLVELGLSPKNNLFAIS